MKISPYTVNMNHFFKKKSLSNSLTTIFTRSCAWLQTVLCQDACVVSRDAGERASSFASNQRILGTRDSKASFQDNNGKQISTKPFYSAATIFVHQTLTPMCSHGVSSSLCSACDHLILYILQTLDSVML